MQVLCSLCLSLKCTNSENSLIFMNEKKETKYKYSENYTNKMKF